MADIHNLIAAISPHTYCDPKVRDEVIELVKTRGYLEASKKAKVIKADDNVFDAGAAYKDALSKWGLKAPIEKHELEYDSPMEGLEPVYFWLLDFLSATSGNVEKIVDNFVSSTGSGQYAEFSQKRVRMQEEAMKMLGSVNQVLKSILNLIWDLKEWEIGLTPYDQLKDNDESKKKAAMLSLKQLWMDTVDFTKRGTFSLKQMAAQYDYVTVIDAFMTADSVEDVLKSPEEGGLDLNERVKKIVAQRLNEFQRWIVLSEEEKRKRYQIEKNYLKSQVSTLKLYSRWLKPYLSAAAQLEEGPGGQPDLVTAFSTTIMDLVLIANDDYKPDDDVGDDILPKSFKGVDARKYHPVVIVEMNFRTMPQRIDQKGNYAYGGRVRMSFTSYALNSDELKIFKEEHENDGIGEVMKLIQGSTEDSLSQIQKDIDHFLGDEKKEEKKEEKPKENNDVDPFTSLFSFILGRKKKKAKDKENADLTKGVPKDDSNEAVFRSQAILAAREKCFKVFDTYKKAHGMASHPTLFDNS